VPGLIPAQGGLLLEGVPGKRRIRFPWKSYATKK
jgi:hypothetical protein